MPASVPVVEEVAGFDISVNDVVRVDMAQSCEQRSHVALHFSRSHQMEVVLYSEEQRQVHVSYTAHVYTEWKSKDGYMYMYSTMHCGIFFRNIFQGGQTNILRNRGGERIGYS